MSMSRTLDALKARRDARGDDGFTLIELLVVVVIIGILVGIAIPLYLQYQNGAKNKSAESDLRGAISAAEQYYSNNSNAYAASANGTATFDLGATGTSQQKITVGDGNTVAYVLADGGLSYKLCSQNKDGKHVFFYDSSVGGSVKDQGVKTLNTTTCA